MCVTRPLQLCVHRHNCTLTSCQLLSALSCKVIEKIFAHEDDTQLIFFKSPCNPNIVNIHVRNKIKLLNVFPDLPRSLVWAFAVNGRLVALLAHLGAVTLGMSLPHCGLFFQASKSSSSALWKYAQRTKGTHKIRVDTVGVYAMSPHGCSLFLLLVGEIKQCKPDLRFQEQRPKARG